MSKKPLLFDDADDLSLSVNTTYAEKFQSKKEREQLMQLSAKYRDDDSDESISEEEDEDAALVTGDVEQDFLKALALIKSNDPTIYQKDREFFKEIPEDALIKKKKEEKPLRVKDQIRQAALSGGVQALIGDEDDEEEELKGSRKKAAVSAEKLSYDQEQRELKKKFLSSLNDENEEESELALKEKTQDEIEAEQIQYEKWLQGEGKAFDKQTETVLEPLRRFWTDPNLNENDKFLRDYITKQMWKGNDVAPAIPVVEAQVDDSDDEDHVEQQEDFERKFNFRFEEEGGTEVQTFPRDIAGSMRAKDTKRKEQRESKKARQEQERLKKDEEIKRLKNLKRKEILDRLKKIQEITGASIDGLQDLDLEGEFQPEAFDKQMAKAFDEKYYEEEEADDKPVFAHDDFIDDEVIDDPDAEADEDADEEYDEEDYSRNKQEYDQDEEFIMDADYVPQPKANKSKKGKKEKEHEDLEELLETSNLKGETKKTVDSFLEEYYGLDFDDIVGGNPTRFRFRQVPANDFGLSAEELLWGNEKQLNRWAPIKRIVKYRSQEEEQHDIRKFHSNSLLKKKTIVVKRPEQLAKEAKERYEARIAKQQEKNAKRADKQKRKHEQDGSSNVKRASSEFKTKRVKEVAEEQETAPAEEGEEEQIETEPSVEDASKKQKRKKNKHKKPEMPQVSSIAESRLLAYHSGGSSKPKKDKPKYD